MQQTLNDQTKNPARGKVISLATPPAVPTEYTNCPLPRLVQDVLGAYGYSVRYNILARRVEVEGLTDIEQLAVRIHAYCQAEPWKERARGLKATKESIYDTLRELSLENAYNPALDIIDALPRDGSVDYFEWLFDLLGIEDEAERCYMRTACWQSYALLHNSLADPIQPQGMLVLQGEQGIGKTTLSRCLSLGHIYPALFGESGELDARDKDKIDKITRYFWAESGEFDGVTKKQDELLKGFITSPIDEYRRPYGRESVRYPRLTSFCATVNSKQFLYDTTGGRRFWVITLNMRRDYQELVGFPWQAFWAQVRDEARTAAAAAQGATAGKRWQAICVPPQVAKEALAARYKDYYVTIPGEQELLNLVEAGTCWKWQLAQQILDGFPSLQRINARILGKALKKLVEDGAGNGTETVTSEIRRANKTYYYFPTQVEATALFGTNGEL